MSVTLGGIAVPDFPHAAFNFPNDLWPTLPQDSGILPLEYPIIREIEPQISVHQFYSGNAMIEQKYLLSDGNTRYKVQFPSLSIFRRFALQQFWEACQGGASTFDLTVPNEDFEYSSLDPVHPSVMAVDVDGGTWDYVRVRFEDQNLSFSQFESRLTSTGLSFVVVPTTVPSFDVGTPLDRFPSLRGPDSSIIISQFAISLAEQIHTIIPLVEIVLADTQEVLHLSDRSVNVGGFFYHPRLADWGPIHQQIGGGSDLTRFVLANGDRVISQIANTRPLRDAKVYFSLVHVDSYDPDTAVGTGTRVSLWAGRLRTYTLTSGPEMPIECDEGLPLSITYPIQNLRECWKLYQGPDCQASGAVVSSRTLYLSSLIDPNGNPNDPSNWKTVTYNFPQADGATCDHGWNTPNGCLCHNNETRFGGVFAEPQTVITKDNSTGVRGYGRSSLASSSQINDTFYSEVLPDIWCKASSIIGTIGYPVDCKIVAGRDEGDFYTALGVVGRGPLSEYALPLYDPTDPLATVPFVLDGQPWHGIDKNTYGLRLSVGDDPVANHDGGTQSYFNDSDKFSLGEGGSGSVAAALQVGGAYNIGSTNVAPQRYNEALFAAGVAFCEIRRTDEKGLQLTYPQGHTMQANVRGGLGGWVWDAPGFRHWDNTVIYPVWVIINIYLRALGLHNADVLEAESAFDVNAALFVQNQVCSLQVPPLIGNGTLSTGPLEDQFVFNGIIREVKSLKDWLDELENTFLGYHVFSNGKLKLGARYNSSALSGFGEGNIIFRSLSFPPYEPTFNKLTCQISDEQSKYVLIPVTFTDSDAAIEMGGGLRPEFRPKTMPLVGVAGKSQATRICITRVREEVGGITPEQRRYHRGVNFKTTILALDTEAGMVCSIDHPDCPDYPPAVNPISPSPARANSVDFRINSWTLNKDYSVDIEGLTSHWEMYDLTYGPKPADVEAGPVPGNGLFAPDAWDLEIWTHHDGFLRINNIKCAVNARSVRQVTSAIYYIDESVDRYGTIVGGIMDATSTIFVFSGLLSPKAGEWIMIEDEIMEVVSTKPIVYNFGYVTVKRGSLQTTAAPHYRINGTIAAINPAWEAEWTVSAGTPTPWRPGAAVVIDDGTDPAFQQQINEVLDNGTTIRLNLPTGLGGMSASGHAVPGAVIYQDPRLWHIKRTDHITSLQSNFFYSAAKANFEDSFTLPNAGIVIVQSYLETTAKVKSRTQTYYPTSAERMQSRVPPFHPAWPYRIRTLGISRIILPMSHLALGSFTDTADSTPVPDAQSFGWALATVWEGSQAAIDTPEAVHTIFLTQLQPSGNVALGGTPDSSLQFQIQVTGGNSISSITYIASDHGITSSSSLTELATSIASWLANDDVVWSTHFITTSKDEILEITDKTFRGGVIKSLVNTASTGVTATDYGFSNLMGINHGRKYATAYVGGPYRSDLSVQSPSTGPSGDATKIEIHDLPHSTDSRVSDIEVYAYFDGDDLTAPVLIATYPNGTLWAEDDTYEGNLYHLPNYQTVTQPSSDGPILITVKRNSNDWFELFIPKDSNVSNMPHGFGIDPIPPDTDINLDIDNQSSADLSLVVELN